MRMRESMRNGMFVLHSLNLLFIVSNGQSISNQIGDVSGIRKPNQSQQQPQQAIFYNEEGMAETRGQRREVREMISQSDFTSNQNLRRVEGEFDEVPDEDENFEIQLDEEVYGSEEPYDDELQEDYADEEGEVYDDEEDYDGELEAEAEYDDELAEEYDDELPEEYDDESAEEYDDETGEVYDDELEGDDEEFDDELDNEFVDYKDYGEEALPISVYDNNSGDEGESGGDYLPNLSLGTEEMQVELAETERANNAGNSWNFGKTAGVIIAVLAFVYVTFQMVIKRRLYGNQGGRGRHSEVSAVMDYDTDSRLNQLELSPSYGNSNIHRGII